MRLRVLIIVGCFMAPGSLGARQNEASTAETCDGKCNERESGGTREHTMKSSGDGAFANMDPGTMHNDWYVGYCFGTQGFEGGNHSYCGGDDDELELMLALVDEGRTRQIAVRLHEADEKWQLNKERHVLQLVGCRGRLVAQIAITPRVAETIGALESSL